jgi:hypothetical protein
MTAATVPEPTALTGAWSMTRQACDLRAGITGSVAGRLLLAADNDEVSWDEQGRLTWDGHDVPVFRSYRFRRAADGWWLHFHDGRPFHPWLPGQWVHHPCRSDSYRGLVTIIGADEWHVRWEVDGPAKSQLITTAFVRG